MTRFLGAALALVCTLGLARAHAQAVAARTPASTTSAPGPSVDAAELRPLDRATVRIVCVHGADAEIHDSRVTRARRIVVDLSATLGSGFYVDANGLVATARHVVAGADTIAVLAAGSDVARPARVVYVDPVHDIAFLHVDGAVPGVVSVPSTRRRLVIAEPLTGSGFPYDVDQRDPAAFVGIVGRENLDGVIHVYAPVNPGNSGGPAVDARGELLGLVSRGGNGIGILEPLRFMLPGLAIARRNLAATPPVYLDGHRLAARIVSDAVGTNREIPVYDRTSIELIGQALSGLPTVEAGILLGVHAWNVHIALLEDHEATEVADLPEDQRATAARLRMQSLRILRHAFEQAPYLSVTYPAGLSILVQGESSVVVRETGGLR